MRATPFNRLPLMLAALLATVAPASAEDGVSADKIVFGQATALEGPASALGQGMKLGLDRNGLYIAYAILTGDTHTMHGCYAIPKADAIAAGMSAAGVSLAHLQTFTHLELDSFPATDLDPKALKAGLTREEVFDALKGHALTATGLVGLFTHP